MFVFSNLATSIDGKIATRSRVHFPLGTKEDRKQMQVLRKRADAVLMGASTLRTFKGPLLIFENGKPVRRQLLNIVISSGLRGIDPRWEFFTEPSIRRLVFVTGKMPHRRIARFEKSCEVVLLKKGQSVARQIVKELGRRGIKKLLVEGGGGVMWDFISENLIDEINLTITPRIVGGKTAPTLVDGAGFEPGQVRNFGLKTCRIVGNELFLVYRRN